MEYIVGAGLALGVGALTTLAGFDRDRSLYPVILVVVASYYDLFAVIGGGGALAWETGIFFAFALAATIGFRTNLWVVVFALVGHGLLDWYHGRLIENAGVPNWWPVFCMSFDAVAGMYLAWRLLSKKVGAATASSFGARVASPVSTEIAAEPFTGTRRVKRASAVAGRP